MWRWLRVEIGNMDPDENGDGRSRHDCRHGSWGKFQVILGANRSSMQRGIKIEAGSTVLIYGGQTASQLAGALIRPFAAGIAQRIFQGGMAVVTEAQDKTERTGLPGEEKGQQADGRK